MNVASLANQYLHHPLYWLSGWFTFKTNSCRVPHTNKLTSTVSLEDGVPKSAARLVRLRELETVLSVRGGRADTAGSQSCSFLLSCSDLRHSDRFANRQLRRKQKRPVWMLGGTEDYYKCCWNGCWCRAAFTWCAEVNDFITHLFSFIHGLQNGHIQLLQSRQDVDIFSQMWSEVLWRRRGRFCFVKHVQNALCLISPLIGGVFNKKEINPYNTDGIRIKVIWPLTKL